jgi:hypothetical protein
MKRMSWVSFGALLACLIVAGSRPLVAQEVAQAPTATPQQVNLSTATPAGETGVTGATPTRTATPEGQIFVEAREFANVRAQPDPNAAQLGQIRSGEQYVAVGRYFQWIQFQYPTSPTGLGWVFGELVDIVGGDVTLIPELADPNANAGNEAEFQAAATQAAVTLTPGGVLTATAATRFEALGQAATLDGPQILPTFTYPPGIAFQPTSAVPAPDETPAPATTAEGGQGALPPIVPILLVGGLGVVGLLINSLRRKR